MRTKLLSVGQKVLQYAMLQYTYVQRYTHRGQSYNIKLFVPLVGALIILVYDVIWVFHARSLKQV